MTSNRTNTINSFVTFFRITLLFVAASGLHAQTKPAELVAKAHHDQTFHTVSFFQKNNTAERTNALPQELKNYVVLDAQKTDLEVFEKNAPEAILFDLPSLGKNLELELVKVDLFPNGFEVKEMPLGKTISSDLAGTHYRGIIKGMTGSIVSLSIVDGEIFGLMSAPGMGNLVLGKMETQEAYLLYDDNDISDKFSYTCGANTDKVQVEIETGVAERGGAQCAGIWLDVGNDIVTDKGGVAAARAYIEALFAQVAVLYANEDINLYLSGMNVWSTPEPFATLSDYKNFQKENAWNGSLAHYINYAHGGGLAWVDALCSDEYGYGVSGITSSFGEAPTYCWSTYVIAHELGHGFGSAHTHDCVWNGNNTPIDVCGFTSCDGEMPQTGGTIMSYCYMTNVGVNMSLGFGEQPGNLMRSRLAAAACATDCNPNNQTLSAGTGNVLPDADVLVFPNPAYETLNIQLSKFESPNISIQLMDNMGRIVRKSKAQGTSTTKMVVNDLDRGMYFLRLQAENGQAVIQKVVLR